MAMRQGSPARYQRERERNRKERDEPYKLCVITWAPSKWRLVDLETGEVYKNTGESWVSDNDLTKKVQS